MVQIYSYLSYGYYLSKVFNSFLINVEVQKIYKKYINARNDKLYNFGEELNFEFRHYNHINHRSNFNR